MRIVYITSHAAWHVGASWVRCSMGLLPSTADRGSATCTVWVVGCRHVRCNCFTCSLVLTGRSGCLLYLCAVCWVVRSWRTPQHMATPMNLRQTACLEIFVGRSSFVSSSASCVARCVWVCVCVCVCYSVCRAWVRFAHEYIRGVNFEQWPDRMRGGGAVHDSVCDPDASHAVCSTLQYAALKHRPLQDMHGASKSMVFIVLIWACTVAAMTAGCAQYPRIADVHASDVCTSSLAMESVAMLQRQLLASSRECSRNCAGVSCTLQQRQQQQQAPALLLLSMCVLHTYGLLNAGRSAELQLEFYMATASICTAWQLVLDS